MKNCFVLVDKESDYTSRDVCNILAKIYDAKKVGHAGTLDPFATGLLIVGLNNATKALSYIEGQYKTYEATLFLGQKTSSGDHTNEVIEEKEVPEINNEIIETVFASLIGESEQIVPITSAVHVNGRKLYQYAHLNQEVELPKRTIDIKELKLLSSDKNVIKFSATVSKGTYIRVLGETIAEKLGTVGHLIALRRTKISSLDVMDASTIKNLNENSVISMFDILSQFVSIKVLEDESEIKKARHGGKLSLKLFPEKFETYCVCDNKKHTIAIYKYSELGYYECARGLDNEDY
ncbi:MAG: tRNA pseudouridine(55) synthase TruB [Bacilli bacterium]|nr:tRNA pseudouridine(55) synthase TruB [Bacilli bacterium]